MLNLQPNEFLHIRRNTNGHVEFEIRGQLTWERYNGYVHPHYGVKYVNEDRLDRDLTTHLIDEAMVVLSHELTTVKYRHFGVAASLK